MAHPVTAVFDGTVFASAVLRDLICELAQAGLVRPRWIDGISVYHHQAVEQGAPHRSTAPPAQVQTPRNDAVSDGLISGYEGLLDTLTLTNPGARRLLAAAIYAGATVIVTYELADFPQDSLAGFHLAAQHPDVFVLTLIETAPGDVCNALKRRCSAASAPAQTMQDLLAALENEGLRQAVARLRELVDRETLPVDPPVTEIYRPATTNQAGAIPSQNISRLEPGQDSAAKDHGLESPGPAPDEFTGYQILGKLGEGGMGVVY